MFAAFALTLAQLGDRAILATLAKSIAVTLALFVATGAGLWWGLDALLAGWRWHGALAALGTGAAMVLAFWLLFRAVAVAVVGVFADDVVAAVEGRHYPTDFAISRAVPLYRSIRMGIGSAGRFVALNLLLLPLYVVLLATGVGAPIAFFVVNGWLLGRDLGDMVAARHLDDAAMRAWRARTGTARFVLGLAGTGLFLVPFLNLVAPVIGAGMATHLFHRSRR